MSTGQANVRTGDYRRMFEKLPKEIQEAAGEAFEMFLEDPYHPALRIHPLDDTKKGRHRRGSRSVSITLRYRAIYVTEGPTNVWYWVGSHQDYDNFTGGK